MLPDISTYLFWLVVNIFVCNFFLGNFGLRRRIYRQILSLFDM